MSKPVIKLNSDKDLPIFWENMPEQCVEVQKQFKGDWVGSYESDVWLICKDKNKDIMKIIPENELPFSIDWKGVPKDDKYGYTPTIKREINNPKD